ncbi:MAG: YncE family protein [Phycisphaeraceae bacterium]
MISRPAVYLALSVFAIVLAHATRAQVLVPTQLPGDYADFALHPPTGDLAALEPEADTLVVFDREDLANGLTRPAAVVKVGRTPVSVCYKKYKDTEVFAVACSQQTRVYLIDAKTHKLLRAIETASAGASQVTASSNPDDPFIYLNYGSGHDSAAGAVNLRDMTYHAEVVDDAMDLAVSADGRLVYPRGPWSPSGFEVNTLTNSFEDDRPAFAQLFREHRSTPPYVADPHGQYVASGPKVYTKGLDREVAELPFTPAAIMKDRALFVGVEMKQSRRGEPGQVTLQLASYNSFQKVGTDASFLLPMVGGETSLPRGVNSQADFKRVGRRIRLLADNERGAVVFAYRKHVMVVPLAKMDAPTIPLLIAELEGGRELIAGKPAQLRIAPADPKINIEVGDKPAGMKVVGNTLAWTPGADDIGSAKVLATLKLGDEEKTQVFELNVRYPNNTLPFDVGGMAIDPEHPRAAVWQAPGRDRFGRPEQRPAQAGATYALAVIDLDTGETLAERRLATPIVQCTLAGEHVLLWNPQGAAKVEVLNRADLARKDTLTTQAPPMSVQTLGDYLVIKTRQSTEVFERATLKKTKSLADSDRSRQHLVEGPRGVERTTYQPEDGLMVGQLLLDDNLKARWVGSIDRMVRLNPKTPYQMNNTMPNAGASLADPRVALNQIRGENGVQRLAYAGLPDGVLTLEQRTTVTQIPGTRNQNITRELTLNTYAAGNIKQQVLARERVFQHDNRSAPPQAQLAVIEGRAVVTHEDKLYQWELPVAEAQDADAVVPMSWPLKQSALTLDASGQTKLEHPFVGGKRPLRYHLQSAYDGVDIDEKTGVVTVRNDAILDAAAEQLARGGRGSIDRMLSQNKAYWDEACALVLGRPARGVPVLLRMQVEASDQDLQAQAMWYHLIVEVPAAAVQAKLESLEAEQRAGQDEGAARLVEAPGAGRFADDAAEDAFEGASNRERQLLQRIDRLERRVDLLTRQVELLLLELQRERRGGAGDARDADHERPEEDAFDDAG